jgi:hypothetical protein
MATTDTEREYIVREVRYLWGTDSSESIARRLGYKNARSLSRMLYRWGYRELAYQITDLKSLSDRLPPWSPR